MKKGVTSYDVAKEAGVSQSAVSRVFLKGRSVSEKTREKVLATAKRMGYKPNAIARMLITQRSGMVAVIMSSRANLNYPEVLSFLNKELTERDERVLLFNLDDEAGLDDLLDNLWNYRVDGVIALAAHFDHSSIQQFEEHNIPVVLYNRKVDDDSASSVCCNHEQSIAQLINLLLENQHKKFLVVAGPTDSDVANERREIALRLLAANGVNDVPVVYGDYSYDSGQAAFSDYLAEYPAPTAVVCGNDSMALGVIDEARKRGLNVPNDLSVVGFDGIDASSWHGYQLTTIKQPIEQMTKAAVDILLEKINSPENPAQMRVWAGKLVTGKSIARAK